MEGKTMKRFLMIAVLAAVVTALLAGTALAAPGKPPAAGLGYGARVQAPDTAVAGDCPVAGDAAFGGMMGRGAWAGAAAWGGQWQECPAELTELLGMTAEELQAERLDGKSLAEIAASKSVSVDEVVDAMMAAKKADLAQLVADGKVTQERADFMLERMETQVTSMIERTNAGAPSGTPMGRGGMGMRGGRGFNR